MEGQGTCMSSPSPTHLIIGWILDLSGCIAYEEK